MAADSLLELDRKYLWRPYTSRDAHQERDFPVIERAQGAWLIDTQGKRYVDGTSSWWCSNLGHNHPRLQRALAAQSERLMHCTLADFTHEAAVRLAAELTAIAPAGLKRVFYSDNGSTAVEVALKIALQYWQLRSAPNKHRFLALPQSYHGDTFGAMGVGGIESFVSRFQDALVPAQIAPESSDPNWSATFDWIDAQLQTQNASLAAVIVEPIVQGAGGMRMYPPQQLKRLRELCTRHNVLLICDEVFTGFARTGTMWASDHANISPDLLCTAKGLTGGVLPFAVTLASEEIYDAFSGGKEKGLMHGHTFFGNPLGAALAREVLAIYAEEKILDGIAARAEMLSAWAQKSAQIRGVSRPRSLGMIAAVDVGDTGYLGETGRKIADRALALGAYLRPLGNTVYLTPPLNIDTDALQQLITATHQAIAEALSS